MKPIHVLLIGVLIAAAVGIGTCIVHKDITNIESVLAESNQTILLEGVVTYRVIENITVQYDSYSEIKGNTTSGGRPLLAGTTVEASDLNKFPLDSIIALVAEDGTVRGPFKVQDNLPVGVSVDLVVTVNPNVRIKPETCKAILLQVSP